jgi:two-component system chemotaxis response regulator CheB
VYIAPGDHHMRVSGGPRDAWLLLDQSPLENGCRPAADPLFETAAKVFGSTVLGLVLTGLGRDGTKGAGAIRKAGGHVWVQDEASATVWGMPGSIVQAGFATRVLPLMNIARALSELKSGGGGPPPTAAGPKPPTATSAVNAVNAPTTRMMPVKPRKP